MGNDIQLNGWDICSSAPSFCAPFQESVFFTGNGRMGVRGYPALRLDSRPVEVGLFVAGIFDEYKTGVTDLVNLPTPIWETVEIDGRRPELMSEIKWDLDLSCGKLTLSYIIGADGKEVAVTEERLFPLTNPALLLQKISFKCISEPARLSVRSGVDLGCHNQPIADDQVKENDEVVNYIRHAEPVFSGEGFSVRLRTKSTGLGIVLDVSIHAEPSIPKTSFTADGVGAGYQFDIAGNLNATYTIEKLTAITTTRDKDPLIAPLPLSWSFESLDAENKRRWAGKWERAGITLEGDDDAQTALRYTTYQLLVNCSPRDDTVNIGARGLTHTRYKGCYFWDTDLFMMPFYLLTEPEAAKSLMQYRINTLPQAKEHAAKMNGAGARYPWMVSFDGTEQCETWDIGCSEVHVTADVAYALGQYMDVAQDKAFFLNGGAEALVETARFWVSRYSADPEHGGVNLLFCKGPDEYCGITSNNLFTNMMVQHNLDMAVEAAQILSSMDPAQYQRLNLTEAELQVWQCLRDDIKLPKDPETGHWRTDDTFHLLEPVDPGALKHGDEASYHQTCFDRLQRYKVVKQADVLLLMIRLSERFTAEERLAAWEDFEPLCLHDSTLSFASHAYFAAQNGLPDAAEQYFSKALYLDLFNVMGNTGKEGLHLACFGETWQAVVFGFAGLRFENGVPTLSPRLPAAWKSLSFRFCYRGDNYQATITANGATVSRC